MIREYIERLEDSGEILPVVLPLLPLPLVVWFIWFIVMI